MLNLLSLLATLLLVLGSNLGSAKDRIPPLQFLAGAYRVSRIDPETQVAYQGLCEIVLQEDGGGLMKRTLGGQTIEAKLTIEEIDHHEGAKQEALVARYQSASKSYAITYLWEMANLFAEDNYGLLVGKSIALDEKTSATSLLQGFETLIPTTGSAESFRTQLARQLEDLRARGL